MKKRIIAAVLAGIMTFSASAAVHAEVPVYGGEYYEAYARKLTAPEEFDASNVGSTSVTLTWSAVDGADAYYVYRYDKSTKKYKTLDTVDKTQYTVTGLKAGTKYTFAVAAAVESDDGYKAQTKSEKLSVKTSAKGTTNVAAPSGIKVAKKGESYITLKWNSVTGADAYRVYLYDESAGEYKTFKNVSGASCKVTGLSAGKEYKFRIASLTKVNGKVKEQKKSGIFKASTAASSKKTLPKKGGEWTTPTLEKGNADSLYTCGIGNCRAEYNTNGGIDYIGETYYNGTKISAAVSTNSDGDIYEFILLIPMTYSLYLDMLVTIEETLSSFSYNYKDGYHIFSGGGYIVSLNYDFDSDCMMYLNYNSNMV